MKKSLFAGLVAMALLFTACQSDPDLTSPTASAPSNEYTSTLTLLNQLDLTTDQLAFVDEMYYMDEDMAVLLDDGRLSTFNQITNGLGDRRGNGPNDGRVDPFPGRSGLIVDLDALMYFRLIMRACDHTEEEIAAIRQLIADSQKARAELVRNATDREELLAALRAEHEALMGAINNLIGEDCVDAIEALKAEIKAKREEIREKMAERRMQAELDFFTKLLGLTEDQVALVKALLIAKHAEIAELRAQYQRDPEGLRAAMQALMGRFDTAMLDILDDEQDAIYLRWRGHTPKNDRPGPDTRLEQEVLRITKMLGLNERQAAQLKDLLAKKMEAEKHAMETYGRDRAALANAMQSINQRFNEAFMALLTPEQAERWKKIHHRGPVDRGPRGG